jgi:hypothetical protein
MDFGKLELVEKTFTREVNNPRGQDYSGIKFRRFVSNKKGKEGQLEETFTISDKLFDDLQLSQYALAQANDHEGKRVLLMVVEDQDEVKPVAKFLRQQVKKDGSKPAKGKMFSNEFVTEGLINYNVLDEKTQDNQYLALEDVGSEFSDMPSVVKGIFKIVKDESVDASTDQEEEATQQEAAPAAQASENF